MRRIWLGLGILAMSSMGEGVDGREVDPARYQAQILEWRAQRLAALQRPEGWLSLVGLHWLEEGRWTLGRAADNDIELAIGPDRLGTIERRGNAVRLQPVSGTALAAEQVGVELGADGAVVLILASDAGSAPSVVRLGETSFVLIERSGRLALRVRDPNAPTRTEFAGLEYFPIDPQWRIEGRFLPDPQDLEILSVVGTVERQHSPGRVEFEREGRRYQLRPVVENPAEPWFFIFADATSGQQTYGLARFLYADPPQNGRITLDFNRAYNPPCAFNAHSTCPLPPEGNRLTLPITAGELAYRGPRSAD